MNWNRVPLPSLILLLSLAGVLRIREQGGEGDGFLMAGAGLVLAGIWAALEVLSRGKEEGFDNTPIQKQVGEAVVRAIDKKTKKTDLSEQPAEEEEPPQNRPSGDEA